MAGFIVWPSGPHRFGTFTKKVAVRLMAETLDAGLILHDWHAKIKGPAYQYFD